MAWQANSDYVIDLLAADLVHGNEQDFIGYGTDTRKNLDGKLFIALEGDQFDAHKFVYQAATQKASGALVGKALDQEQLEKLEKDYPSFALIQCDDSLLGLQKLANAWRKDCGFTVIGITGSNGKTTTKEFLQSILSHKYKTYSSEGSLNNHWGVPFTLLNASPQHEVVIAEMGMNNPGEIHRLCEIAEPDHVCVTFVGRGHLEGLGSIEGVAKEKASIYKYSKETKKVFNLDNPYTKKMYHEFSQRDDVSFASTTDADVSMAVVDSALQSMQIEGKILDLSFAKEVQIYGKHNVTNLMAASGLALLVGMSPYEIVNSFNNLKMAWGRNQVMEIGDHLVVFDGYNANPDSMDAFLSNAADVEVEGNKFLLLGEMLELGESAPAAHEALARAASQANFKAVHFFGPSFKHFEAGLETYKNKESCVLSSTYEESLAKKIQSMLEPKDAIFIKASRGMRLERFMDLLRE